MVRSTLFNLTFWPVFAAYVITLFPLTCVLQKSFALKAAYRPITKMLLFCLKHMTGIGCKIENLDNVSKLLKNTNVIIGCNHQSVWETFIFSILIDKLSIVVKEELLKIPIAGVYFKKLGCLPINRASSVAAIKSLVRRGKELGANGENILIFPNGTRSSADENVEYKSGIFALYKTLGIPVVPASVDSGKYWPRRTFKKTKGIITLSFKEPILPGLSKGEFFKVFEERMSTR